MQCHNAHVYCDIIVVYYTWGNRAYPRKFDVWKLSCPNLVEGRDTTAFKVPLREVFGSQCVDIRLGQA